MQCYAPKEWRDTLPDGLEVDQRIRELVDMDYRITETPQEVEPKLIPLFAQRIEIRAYEAQQALDRGDEEKARYELRKLEALGDALRPEVNP